MSVFIKITTPGGAVYRLSDGPAEHSGFSWRPKLTNTVSIERAARATENGIPTTTQTLNVWNAERYIGVVDESLNDALTDSAVEIEVTGIDGSWNGIIKAWEQGSNGLLSIRAGQDTLALLKRQVPDETVRLVTFTGASRDAVNTTIPTAIGGTTSDPIPVPGILIDRAGFTWAFCVGKCRSFVRVKSDRKTITTGFTTYLGTADQAIWPGMVCVKFDADPRDSNGAWPEISAELVGLEIGSTEAEGRNAARVIRAYLTTADTGACGWGLGEPADSIDTVSFDQAILDCDTLELHLDGMMSQAALSSYWLSQMCLGGRLRLDKPAGKWRLRVDMATDSVKEYDENNILLYSFWPGDSSMRHKRARVNYRADFITKQFLGSATRTIGTIGEEENLLEQHLVRDHTTGNALADYVANIEKYGELRMQIQTPDVAVGTRTLEEDEVVTIRVPEFPNGRLFRVTSLSQGTDESKIELRSYADAIFDIATPESTTDPSLDPIVRAAPLPAPPMDPSGLDLQTNVRVQPDGTIVGYVDITFTPGTNALFTRIEVGEGASPTSWVELGVVGNNGTKFHHEPAKVGQNYTYRLTSVNTGGSSSVITGNITVAADTTAPLVPQAPVLSTYFKSIAVKCLQNLTMASDHASFDVYRNTANDSGTAAKVGSAPCLGNTDSVVYLDETTAFDTTYYYWVKSVDTSGNISGFSAAAGPVSTQRIIAGDIGTSALNSSSLFAAGVVDAAALADCAVTAAKTALAAVDRYTGKIALAAIDNPNMFTGRPVDSTVVTTGELLTLSAQIKDVIVTSAKIVSLDAGKITTGSLDAGRIAAGSLLGCHIAANTITASNLLIAAPGSALNEDPGFLDPSAWGVMDGYETYTGVCITTVTDGKVGTGVLRGDGCSGKGYNGFVGCRYIPIDPTKVYRLRAWIRARGTTNGCVYLSLREYNNAKTTLSSNLGTYLVSGAAPSTTWTLYSGYIGPSGCSGLTTCFNAATAWVRIGGLWDYNTTSGSGYEMQDFRLEEVLPATLIQDGAITTSKIIATGIDGACICAGSITSGHIVAGGICADVITSGVLNGITVCTCSGSIGGWCIIGNLLSSPNTWGSINLYSSYSNFCMPMIEAGGKVGGGTTTRWINMGHIYWNGGYKCAWGFSIYGNGGGSFVAASTLSTGVCFPDGCAIGCDETFFWLGDTSKFIKWDSGSGNLHIRGDLQVSSGGNILPDPDFRGISPNDACKYYWPASSSVIGEWRVYFTGVTSGVLAIHKQSAYCTALRYPGSNAFRLCACSVSSYAYVASANYFPIKGCTAYLFSGYFARETSTAVKVYAGMFFYNASGTCVGGADNTLLAGEDVTTTLTRRSACIVSPATAAYASIIVYNYHPAAVSYLHVSALSVQELNSTSETDAPWNVGNSGSITANMVKTGCILSMNWGTAAGSCFDLNAGTFYLGGSSAPSLSWDGSSLVVRGTVCATAGCFSGSITSCSGSIGGWSLACDRLYQYIGVSGTQICAVLSQTMYRLKYIVPLLQGNEITLQSAVCSATSDCAAILINTGGDATRWGLCTNGKIQVASVCCTSDRNAKENIVPVSVLGRIRNLPISEWSFKGDLIRHVSPMAQDFYEVFKGYSSDPKAIGGLDGIALKGVQELDACVESLKTCVRSLEDRLCNLETRLAA